MTKQMEMGGKGQKLIKELKIHVMESIRNDPNGERVVKS